MRLGLKTAFRAAPKLSAKLQYLSKTADFDVGKLFFRLVIPFLSSRQMAKAGSYAFVAW